MQTYEHKHSYNGATHIYFLLK